MMIIYQMFELVVPAGLEAVEAALSIRRGTTTTPRSFQVSDVTAVLPDQPFQFLLVHTFQSFRSILTASICILLRAASLFFFQPLFSADACLPQYSLKQIHTYRAMVRIWNGHDEISTNHVRMASTFKGAFKTKLTDALDQFRPTDRRKFSQLPFPVGA